MMVNNKKLLYLIDLFFNVKFITTLFPFWRFLRECVTIMEEIKAV